MDIGRSYKTIIRAIYFLKSHQSNSLWCDFNTFAGCSDEWVSAFVACQLASTGNDDLCTATLKSLERRIRPSLLWGYNRLTPADADSSFWFLYLSQILGHTKSLRRRIAISRLTDYQRSNGGFSTYNLRSSISRFTKAGKEITFKGWTSPHVSVTAAALQLNEFRNNECARSFLLSEYKEDVGHWKDYWWVHPEYPTALAISALVHDERWMQHRTLEWIDHQACVLLSENASPFRVAWLLRCALHFDKLHLISRTLAYRLLELQRPDGAWDKGAELRIPHPNTTNPDEVKDWRRGGKGSGSIILDDNRIFSTASIVGSLCKYKQHVS